MTTMMWGVLDQVVSLVFQAIITWALAKVLPNFYNSLKKQSMFKSFTSSNNTPMGNCPAGLTKAKVPAPPPGLSLPENPGSPSIYQPQPDEKLLDIKSPPSANPKVNSMVREPSHQLLRRMKQLNLQDLKDGNVSPWVTLAEALARSTDPENASTLLKSVIQEGFTSDITTNHYSVIVTAFARKGNAAKAA